ncbi:MAG TPA: hypothetical protein VNJ03_01890 [Vicinamibacterales bacterium]|nr:hypothetical protein [Vicinamibacterales bacterium]
MRMLSGVLGALWGMASAVLGIAAAMLPRRYWPMLDRYVPASWCAMAAALLTLLADMLIGIPGFLHHITEQISLNNAALVRGVEHSSITRNMMGALSALSLFTFLLLTPQGWATMYLSITGLVRTVGAHFDDPHGDAFLTVVDAGIHSVAGAVARRGEIDNRALLEGEAVPDRVARGSHLGLPDVEFVIVSSRIKAGWDAGTVLITESGAYRVVCIEDRTIHGRLRHVYGVNAHNDLEVIRRGVQYRWPDTPRESHS